MRLAFSKIISIALAVVVFATNCLLVHAAETNLWSQRRESLQKSNGNSASAPLFASLPVPSLKSFVPTQQYQAHENLPFLQSLPAALGTIRKINTPVVRQAMLAENERRLVIHIQDVHQNKEAQENIGKALQALIDKSQVDLIALEGAFDTIDLSAFRSFPHQDSIRKVADTFLQNDKISGPLHTALTSTPSIPPVVGIDDPIHYQTNVDAYKRSAPLIKPYKEIFSVQEEKLDNRKSKFFNTKLKAFDTFVQSYRKGTSSLGDYIRVLSGANSHLYPSVEIFQAALQLETSLDFSKVEVEKSALVTQLLQKLSKNESKRLIDLSVAYRLGNMSHAAFYTSLKTLCEKSGIFLTRFPAMNNYVQYILLSDKIHSETLFSDMREMEKEVYDSLAKSSEERALIDKSRQLYLVGKLLDFSLTTDEWQAYRKTTQTQLPGMNLESFESFYKEAEARDLAMAQNLLNAMDKHNAKSVVLVTGGFHTQGIETILEKRDITTVTFIPKISKVETENGSAYLTAFTQEKTPLNKLFDGNKLFLAQLVLSNSGRTEIALAVASEEVKSVPGSNFKRIASALLIGSGLVIVFSISIFGKNLCLAVLNNQEWVILTVGAAGVSLMMIPRLIRSVLNFKQALKQGQLKISLGQYTPPDLWGGAKRLLAKVKSIVTPHNIIMISSFGLSFLFGAYHFRQMIFEIAGGSFGEAARSFSLMFGGFFYSMMIVRLCLLALWVVGSDFKPILREDTLVNQKFFANRPLAPTALPDQMPNLLIAVPIYTEDFDKIRPTLEDSLLEAANYSKQMGDMGAKATGHLVVYDDGLQVLAANDVDGVVRIVHEALTAQYGSADADNLEGAVRSQFITASQAEVFKRVLFYEQNNVNVVARPKYVREFPSTERLGFFKKPSNLNFGLKLADDIAILTATGLGYEEALRKIQESEIRYQLGWYRGRVDFAVGDDDILLALDKDSRTPIGITRHVAEEFVADPLLAYTQHRTVPVNEDEGFVARAIGMESRLRDFILSPMGAMVSERVEFRGHNGFIRRKALREVGYWDETGGPEDFHFFMQTLVRGYHGKYIAYKKFDFGEAMSRSFSEESGRFGRFAFQCFALLFNPSNTWLRKGLFREDFKSYLRSPHLTLSQKIEPFLYFNFYVVHGMTLILVICMSMGGFVLGNYLAVVVPTIVTFYMFWFSAVLTANMIGPARGVQSAATGPLIFLKHMMVLGMLWTGFPIRIMIGLYQFISAGRPDMGSTNVDDMSHLSVRELIRQMKDEHRETGVLFVLAMSVGVVHYLTGGFTSASLPIVFIFMVIISYYAGNPFLLTAIMRTLAWMLFPAETNLKSPENRLRNGVLFIQSVIQPVWNKLPNFLKGAITNKFEEQPEPLSAASFWRQPIYGLLGSLMVVSFLVRISNLNYNYWHMDEAFNVYVHKMGNGNHLAGNAYVWSLIADIMYRIGGLTAIRSLTAVIGTLTIPFVFVLARRFYRQLGGGRDINAAALLAACAFSFSAPALFTSSFGTYDQLAYFLFTVGFWLLQTGMEKNNKRWLHFAGVVLFTAFITRYMLLLYVPVIIAYALVFSALPKHRVNLFHFLVPFVGLGLLYGLFNAESIGAAISHARVVGAKYATGQTSLFVLWQFIGRIYPTLLVGFLGLSVYALKYRVSIQRRLNLYILALGSVLVGVYHVASHSDLQMAKNLNLSVLFASMLFGLAFMAILNAIKWATARAMVFAGSLLVAVPMMGQARNVTEQDQQAWADYSPVIEYLQKSGLARGKSLWSGNESNIHQLRLKLQEHFELVSGLNRADAAMVDNRSPWYAKTPSEVVDLAEENKIDVVVVFADDLRDALGRELERGYYYLGYEVAEKIHIPYSPPVLILIRQEEAERLWNEGIEVPSWGDLAARTNSIVPQIPLNSLPYLMTGSKTLGAVGMVGEMAALWGMTTTAWVPWELTALVIGVYGLLHLPKQIRAKKLQEDMPSLKVRALSHGFVFGAYLAVVFAIYSFGAPLDLVMVPLLIHFYTDMNRIWNSPPLFKTKRSSNTLSVRRFLKTSLATVLLMGLGASLSMGQEVEIRDPEFNARITGLSDRIAETARQVDWGDDKEEILALVDDFFDQRKYRLIEFEDFRSMLIAQAANPPDNSVELNYPIIRGIPDDELEPILFHEIMHLMVIQRERTEIALADIARYNRTLSRDSLKSEEFRNHVKSSVAKDVFNEVETILWEMKYREQQAIRLGHVGAKEQLSQLSNTTPVSILKTSYGWKARLASGDLSVDALIYGLTPQIIGPDVFDLIGAVGETESEAIRKDPKAFVDWVVSVIKDKAYRDPPEAEQVKLEPIKIPTKETKNELKVPFKKEGWSTIFLFGTGLSIVAMGFIVLRFYRANKNNSNKSNKKKNKKNKKRSGSGTWLPSIWWKLGFAWWTETLVSGGLGIGMAWFTDHTLNGVLPATILGVLSVVGAALVSYGVFRFGHTFFNRPRMNSPPVKKLAAGTALGTALLLLSSVNPAFFVAGVVVLAFETWTHVRLNFDRSVASNNTFLPYSARALIYIFPPIMFAIWGAGISDSAFLGVLSFGITWFAIRAISPAWSSQESIKMAPFALLLIVTGATAFMFGISGLMPTILAIYPPFTGDNASALFWSFHIGLAFAAGLRHISNTISRKSVRRVGFYAMTLGIWLFLSSLILRPSVVYGPAQNGERAILGSFAPIEHNSHRKTTLFKLKDGTPVVIQIDSKIDEKTMADLIKRIKTTFVFFENGPIEKPKEIVVTVLAEFPSTTHKEQQFQSPILFSRNFSRVRFQSFIKHEREIPNDPLHGGVRTGMASGPRGMMSPIYTTINGSQSSSNGVLSIAFDANEGPGVIGYQLGLDAWRRLPADKKFAWELWSLNKKLAYDSSADQGQLTFAMAMALFAEDLGRFEKITHYSWDLPPELHRLIVAQFVRDNAVPIICDHAVIGHRPFSGDFMAMDRYDYIVNVYSKMKHQHQEYSLQKDLSHPRMNLEELKAAFKVNLPWVNIVVSEEPRNIQGILIEVARAINKYPELEPMRRQLLVKIRRNPAESGEYTLVLDDVPFNFNENESGTELTATIAQGAESAAILSEAGYLGRLERHLYGWEMNPYVSSLPEKIRQDVISQFKNLDVRYNALKVEIERSKKSGIEASQEEVKTWHKKLKQIEVDSDAINKIIRGNQVALPPARVAVVADALIDAANYISGNKETVPVNELWNVVNLKISDVFTLDPNASPLNAAELTELTVYLQNHIEKMNLESDDAHRMSEILSKWVGRSVQVGEVNLEVVVRGKDIEIEKVRSLINQWKGKPITLVVDEREASALKEFKGHVSITEIKNLVDGEGHVQQAVLEEHVRTSFNGTASASMLTFSRDLIPGLQITAASPLFSVEFKPLEDLLAELNSASATIHVLPLGTVLALFRVLALQA